MAGADIATTTISFALLVLLLVTFASRRNLYAVGAYTQASSKHLAHTKYNMMLEGNLLSVGLNSASVRGGSETKATNFKNHSLVTIPESKNCSITVEKLTIENLVARLSKNYSRRPYQFEFDPISGHPTGSRSRPE